MALANYTSPEDLGSVVQSIVSLTTSLRRQLVKFMPITFLKTLLLFFIGKKCGDLLHCILAYSVIFTFKIFTYNVTF